VKRRSAKTLLATIANASIWRRILQADRPNKNSKPGEVIQKLSAEEREILKGLKSDDIKDDKLPYQP